MNTTSTRKKWVTAALGATVAAAALPAVALAGAGTVSAETCRTDLPVGQPGQHCKYWYPDVPAGATDCIQDIDVARAGWTPSPSSMSPPNFDPAAVWCQPPPPPITVPSVKAGPKVTFEDVPGGLMVRVEDLTGEAADCVYTANPRPGNNPLNLSTYQHRFHLPAKQPVSWRIDGFLTGTMWDVVVDCGGTRVTRTERKF